MIKYNFSEHTSYLVFPTRVLSRILSLGETILRMTVDEGLRP